MQTLGRLLAKRKNVSKISLTDKDIFYIFSRVIKEEFGNVGALRLPPDFYKNGTVFVRASNSIWGSELFSNRTEIIKKMNKELGENIIKEIKLK
jgi:hypothetical protein